MSNHSHTCQAIVITCIDFRFQKYIEEWTTKFISGGYDKVAIAGAVKDLDYILSQIEISVRLHGTKEAYLINHEDCGAYGEAGTFEKHKEDLLAAKKAIEEKFPQLTVIPYFLKLSSEFIKV